LIKTDNYNVKRFYSSQNRKKKSAKILSSTTVFSIDNKKCFLSIKSSH